MLAPIFIERSEIHGASLYHKRTSEEKKYMSFYDDKVVKIVRNKAASEEDAAYLKVYITELDLYDFDGELHAVIERLLSYNDPRYAKIELSILYGYDYEGDARNKLGVYGYRNETKEETLARVEYEKEKKAKKRVENKAAKAAAIAKEQAEYERLKKKFEKGE